MCAAASQLQTLYLWVCVSHINTRIQCLIDLHRADGSYRNAPEREAMYRTVMQGEIFTQRQRCLMQQYSQQVSCTCSLDLPNGCCLADGHSMAIHSCTTRLGESERNALRLASRGRSGPNMAHFAPTRKKTSRNGTRFDSFKIRVGQIWCRVVQLWAILLEAYQPSTYCWLPLQKCRGACHMHAYELCGARGSGLTSWGS